MVELRVHPVALVGRQHAGRGLQVVLRQERQEVAGVRRHASSSSAAKCATPDFVACAIAPPSDSASTSSPVTVRMTSGPVMNMYDVSFTMKMKSVIAGE